MEKSSNGIYGSCVNIATELKKEKNNMIIAVDFDGTIVTHAFPNIGIEYERATETLKDLKKEGHEIILWTCREGELLKQAVEWLKFKGFVPDAVNENINPDLEFAKRKIFADIYLDDRSFPAFTSWQKVRDSFLMFKMT